MSFASAFSVALKRPSDPDALIELADRALQEGEEERALPLLERGATQARSAVLWQWKGLLERSLDEHGKALESFTEAARLDPRDARIAHGLARVALEAGIPAERAFEQALRLAPSDGSVLMGLAAARLAAGHGDRAETELDAILAKAPLWIDGHHQLAQLRSMLGRRELATASLERALTAEPGQPALWQALLDLDVKREDFAGLADLAPRARVAGIDPAILRPYDAIAAAELGKTGEADGLFAGIDSAGGPPLAIWRIRHLLRTGRAEQARAIIDQELAGPAAAAAWPYALIAWRVTGDPRFDWLVRDGKLVSGMDLAGELPPLERLADVLRSIHLAKAEYLDQSVRGGTQTDGPLFSLIEPEIRTLRSAVVGAVGRYIAALPAPEPRHPLLSPPRDRRIRFAGSWSVRLKGEGFHSSHVHPQGWISSALYVALPPEEKSGHPNAGWLQLGEPGPDLGLGLSPLTMIRPEPGRLVLFPSWMWHGTVPFPAGERLTVAFDVAVPR